MKIYNRVSEALILDIPDLRGANLYKADLRGANLYKADLHEADLRGANLYGADLRGANRLHGADLNAEPIYAEPIYVAEPICGANLHFAWSLRCQFMQPIYAEPIYTEPLYGEPNAELIQF